jgi:hypothetical protein
MHLFMVQVDYRLFGTGWCMVDALVYVDRLISVEDCCLISVGAEVSYQCIPLVESCHPSLMRVIC